MKQGNKALFLAALVANVAQATNYTRCRVPSPSPTSTDYCLPMAGNNSDKKIQIVKQGGLDTIVAVVPVKNCRTKSSNVRGGISIAVDNSQSRSTTDPNSGRLDAATYLLDQLAQNAAAQVSAGAITSSSADFPQVGAISYAGRQGQTNGYDTDGLNFVFSKSLCNLAEGGSGTRSVTAFPSSRWDAVGGVYYSICDFLSPVKANVTGTSGSTTPSMTRLSEFISTTGAHPRGSTDLTYILEAIQHDSMLGLIQSNAKNAIVISDGLPNIPKRVPESVCKTKNYLSKEELGFDKDAPAGVNYCVDRQFREGVNEANSYLETNSRFQNINVYQILYIGAGKGFIDIDDQGELNPADFLIENSARTGNGKVKFKFAKSKEALESYLTSLFENFSTEAVQRVEITVNNNPTYNAVSLPSFDTLFTMKFIGLKTGTNTVKVTAVYSDSKVSQNFEVDVAESGNSDALYNCEVADGGLTVDGDDPTSKTPSGDGVLPFPKSDGTQDRVYRNSDPENNYSAADFEKADVASGVTSDGETLRLQGGTGNCGVVSGALNGKSILLQVFLLLLPGVFLIKRRRLFVIFVMLFLGSSLQARASGINVENLVPALSNSTGLLWEDSHVEQKDTFDLGYTFDYALHPIEYGNGNNKRVAVNDHLLVNHFSVVYGALSSFDFGLDIPLGLYSDPQNPSGALSLQSAGRKSFFLGDVNARLKVSPRFARGSIVSAAIVGSLSIPTGSEAAMMSDGALKFNVLLPVDFKITELWGAFFVPGVNYFSNANRLEATSGGVALSKQSSLLLSVGARYALLKKLLAIEGGVRGEFASFKPTLNGRASPMEWAVGGRYSFSQNLSFHGSFGTGIGSGVGAPLTRIVLGARYLIASGDDEDTEETSESLSERELDSILLEAQHEMEPRQYSKDEAILKLLYGDQVLDLGNVNFEFNSWRLTQETRRTVEQLYSMLLQMKAKSVRIEGHTDSIGSYRYNLALSKRRAEAVKAELVRNGMDAKMITTEGFSFKYPTATNATRAGRAANRRIEVSVDGHNFKKPNVSKEQIHEWIYPNGKQPTRQDESDQ